MDNIIECRLNSTCKEIFTGLWQYDYGQILRITGVEFPKAVEVQFSLNEKSGSVITRIGTTTDGVTEVKIPDELLKNEGHSQDYSIYAYIYLTDETSGNTEYKIVLHVKSRTKPENPTEEPLPEPNIFHETVVAVNASAERAEKAEQKAKASATEASKYASSASDSAAIAEKTKEAALKEVGEKKREAIEAIQNQEETSVEKITTHTDDEIQRIKNQIAESKGELEQTITNAGVSKEELNKSIETARDTKTALDKSTELAETEKTELDTSIREAGTAKNALDESTEIAGTVNETLSATVKQAGALDTSLGEKIETGTQLKTDIVASGEKAVKDIQTAGSEQLSKMQAVAEAFTADREQIATNKEDINSLKEEMSKNYLDDAKTKRSLDALWKLNQGISYQFETDDTEAYQKTVPSGAKLASIKKIGGRLDNEGTFMSAPVNEVIERGKNLFDFSRLVSDGVNVMDYEKQTITVPAKTNNTGYNQTLRDLCPGITPGTYVFSAKRSNPESGNGSYFLEAGFDFTFNTPTKLTDALLDNHIAWYNNPDSEIENVISEIQIEKNSVKTSYSQYHKKSYKIPQAILNLDGYGESGNFVDFVEKKYHKGDRIIDISNIIGDTFQEPFEVEAGGTLTFKNSHGDDYRIPVPSSVEYVISLAEVAK